MTTAVLRPENEKSEPSSSIGRGKAIASGSPRVAERVDGGSARIAEAEEARDLVERLARGVVDGLPERLVVPVIAHRDEQRVAARRDERDERRLEGRVVEQRRVHVAFVVVHADVRAPGHERQRLRRAHADEQRAREPGPVTRGDRVDLGEVDAGFDAARARSPR